MVCSTLVCSGQYVIILNTVSFQSSLTSLGLLFHSLSLFFSSLLLTFYALQFNDVPNKELFFSFFFSSFLSPSSLFLSQLSNSLIAFTLHLSSVCLSLLLVLSVSLKRIQTSTSPQTKTRVFHFGNYEQILPVVSAVLQHKHDRTVM